MGITNTTIVEAYNKFNFLNNIKSFDFENMDWKSPEMSKLWRYNLHYFDYIKDKERSKKSIAGLISNWITNNPVGAEDAWEPFTVSLRIVNWIKLFLKDDFKAEVESNWLQSLFQQALWLEKNIEYHLLANHYFKNGKALFFAGIYFQGSDADRFLKKSLKILMEEIEEQILPDGGHFERSPMYHSMILEDCLDLLNIIVHQENPVLKDFARKLEEKTESMVEFLVSMCHPDGQISLFNDAAVGIEAEPSQLVDYYERVNGKKLTKNEDSIQAFPDSGYFILAPDSENKLILDCGHVGPEYQPGHSHCDALSFELSVKGQRVIVDSACFQYVDGPIRQYNRGNIGHNTITIDGENQSEVWGAHRCARKARPFSVETGQGENGMLFFKGSHDGYKRLRGKPVHCREVTFQDQVWKVSDRVEGKGNHSVQSRLHLHPSMELEFEGNVVIAGTFGERFLKIRLIGNSVITIEKGWYCPEFGKKYDCDVLVYEENKIDLPFECGWELEMVN